MHNPERPLTEVLPATKLGRYEIVCKLGVGGMADVYLAHQPGPFAAGKLVVLKHLRAGVVEDAQFLQMFADESRIAVRLNHPNVVHTYEVVAEGRDYYLILEFLDGRSLYQVLQAVTRERVPLSLHVWVLTQVLTGLHYAHELKDFNDCSMCVVHRDVSPSNVFITYEGEVKILDFGIAKSTAATSATREGVIKGKLGYAAPEQCLCKETDRRTDLYAVGVMLWEALAERKRSLGETSAATYQARIQGAEPPIEQVAPAAPPELVKICNRALEHQPEQRYQTALEFRQALEQYLKSAGWTDGVAQLRAFMQEHFSVDMADMRQRIDAHIGRSQANLDRQNLIPARANSLLPHSGMIETRDLQAAVLPNEAKPSLGTSSSQRKKLVVVGALVGSAITIAVVAWLFMATAKHRERAEPVTRDVAQMSATLAPESGAQRTRAKAAEILVSLSATPTTAVLLLDGRRISNPYRAAHGLDGTLHHLTVSLDGYETVEKELLFDRSIEANFALLAMPMPQKKEVTAPTRTSRVVPSSAKARGTFESVTNPSSPAGAAPQPGEDLRGTLSRSKTRDIEETDPYKR